ncbi:RagB/SusD family nutrient uptake outer membrane protein [Niabella ginsengisoli]|uniref:RagB/SusD family nutrient uptake outer membrane protein n=1 Tax=Niabella ginsengisoli TaxID=522298 RepID=UPI0021D452CF|nr:RagB/SusD family nutrient uptake outer membrane protein [Niabella ginsengisoli]
MYKRILLILFPITLAMSSCNKFIDVIPDNVPVIEHAFNLRTEAEGYLATCYNRLPASTNTGGLPGYFSADEFWLNSTSNYSAGAYPGWYIAQGQQNSNSPLLNYWGSGGSGTYWQAINDCNVFIERVFTVPDMEDYEKERWAAEAKFLKAYYHYLLVRAYGPIIIKDENVPVFADPSESHVPRVAVDACFDYIVKTIDEAMPYLLEVEENPIIEIGRVTQVVAKAVKAEILVEAASPLFNGNTDMQLLKDDNGNPLFNQTYDENKWVKAAAACKEAIDFAHLHNKKLHVWTSPANFTVNGPNTQYKLNLRTAVSGEDASTETLWYDTRSIAGLGFQTDFTPRGLVSDANHSGITSFMGATLNMAQKFYSANGVPIDEDKTYPYAARYELTTVPNQNKYKYDLIAGYTTVRFHLDREPRFYGTLSFDGGRYLMLFNKNDADAINTDYKSTGNIKPSSPTGYTNTGYMVKKYVNIGNTYGSSNRHDVVPYALSF